MNTPSLPFDLSTLRVCCHGSIYAIGGPVEIVERIANIINNLDRSQPVVLPEKKFSPEFASDPGCDRSRTYSTLNRRAVQVYKTHKTFAYVAADENSFAEAFEYLRRLAIPRSGKRSALRTAITFARKLSRLDFVKIERENFLGWQAGNNSFIDLAIGGKSVDDSSGEWRATAFADGATRAGVETLKASAA